MLQSYIALLFPYTLEVPDLKRILAQPCAWNTDQGLTGVLLYGNGSIMQVLESAKNKVRGIFARISRNARHAKVKKLADGPIAHYQFEQWPMQFKALNYEEFARPQGDIAPQQSARNVSRQSNPDADLHAVLAAFATQNVVRF